MNDKLETLIANAKFAARNRETIMIGGGEFRATELSQFLQDYARLKAILPDVITTCCDVVNGWESLSPPTIRRAASDALDRLHDALSMR